METYRTGRTEHETAERMPLVLDCGHGVERNVIVGYHPDPEGVRRRTYECRTCGRISYGDV